MIVVLDTNVVVAGLLTNGLCREVVQRTIRARVLATSVPLLDELGNTLRRKFGVGESGEAFLAALRRAVTLVEPAHLPRKICRDPADDVVLATAAAAQADVIVTGDQDLLVLEL